MFDICSEVEYQIYKYLGIFELVNLSLINKKTYNDDHRKYLVTQKVIFSYIYRNGIFGTVEDFPLFYKCISDELDFRHLYLNKLSMIYFSDIKLIRDQFNKKYIQISSEADSFIYKECGFSTRITYFPKMFDNVDTNIIENVLNNLYRYRLDLWKYAEDNNQLMILSNVSPSCHYFDFYTLFDSINHFLIDTFKFYPNLRENIYDKLLDQEEITKNSREFSNRRSNYFFEGSTNQLKILDFILDITIEYYELDLIVAIGEFILSKDELLCYHYLREKFDAFIDFDNDVGIHRIIEFNELLNRYYDLHYTYKEKLLHLFTECNYTVQDEFEKALNYKLKVYNGKYLPRFNE